MTSITASVGLGGENRRRDVIAVQSLLQAAGLSPGPIDGRCGRLTIHAIEQFQTRIIRRPDGRIDPRGPTLRHLTAKPAPTPHQAPIRMPRPIARPTTTRHAPPSPARPPLPSPPARPAIPRAKPPTIYWKEHTPLPQPSVNAGLVCPSSAQMMQIFGDPNGSYAKSCVATESVGPFRATGLKPALMSMRAIFSRVYNDSPELYGIVASRGMQNIRKVRGGQSYSNHAWGIAIDLKIAGESPELGDPFSLRGLDALAPYFHKAGWYWGGGYRSVSRKDAMHFECGLALVRSFNL